MPDPDASPGAEAEAGVSEADLLAAAGEDLSLYISLAYPSFRLGAHHQRIIEALEDVAAGRCKRLVISLPPRHGKPCYDGSMILMSNGARKRLDEVCVGDHVISHSGVPRRVMAVHVQGELECVRLRTGLGRETMAALDHPFLTPEGWKAAGELDTTDVLACVPAPKCMTASERTTSEFIFAGYMLGDGCTAPNPRSIACDWTSADPLTVDDFTAQCERLGFRVRHGGRYRYNVRGEGRKGAGPRHWLRASEGIIGTSWTKRVPPWVFKGDGEQVGAFLGAYFACDGHLNRRGGTRTDCALEFYSVNHAILTDVQHLLLRLGVRSRLVSKNGRDAKGEPHKSWRLAVTSLDDVARFALAVRVVGAKAERLLEWQPKRTSFMPEFIADPVAAIERVGLRPCRCLTVEHDHTFTLDDLVVHNSLVTSEHFPAWYLGRNPSHQIISATYGQALANDFGLKVRNQVGDPLFQGVFPGVGLTRDSSSAKKFRTPQGGVYVAIGRGGSATGRGAHLLIVDDPYKDMTEADSAAIRARVQQFYSSTAYTRLMPGGAIVVIHTRWRDDDLIGWLLREHAHEGWRELVLPAIDVHGNALWPSDYPLPALRRIKRTLTAREWSALYQQRPYAEEGAILKRHWWRPWCDPKPKRPDMVIISVDGAMTADAQNDPSGITIWYVCPDDTGRSCALLVGALREWLEFGDLLDAIDGPDGAVSMFGVRGVPLRVLVENKANGLPIIQELRRRAPDLGVFQAKALGDKVSRAYSVQSLFQHDPANDMTGRVYALARMERIGDPAAELDEDGNDRAGTHGLVEEPVFRPWAQMVIDECAAFPLAAHDDLVDSVTHALRHMRTIGVEFFAEDEPPPPPPAGPRTKRY